MDPAAKADPFQALQQAAEFIFDPRKLPVEQVEIGVFAVVMDHEARDAVHHGFDLGLVPFPQAREGPSRISQIEAAGREPRGVTHSFGDLMVGPCDGIGVGFLAEFLAPQAQFIQAGGCGAVHVLAHLVKHRPSGEAFQCEQGLCPGSLAQLVHDGHVPGEFRAVDQVERRLDHLESPPGPKGKRKRAI